MQGQPIHPDLMKLMQGGGGDAGASNSGPVSSPMMTQQPNDGEKQAAEAQVQIAIAILEQTLHPLGSSSDEGRAVLTALKTLGDKFGSSREKGRELVPSEIMNLMASMPQGAGGGAPHPGAPPPAPPGAPPPGMPPGAGAPPPQ